MHKIKSSPPRLDRYLPTSIQEEGYSDTVRWADGPLLLVKSDRVDFVMHKIKGSPLPGWHVLTKNSFDA